MSCIRLNTQISPKRKKPIDWASVAFPFIALLIIAGMVVSTGMYMSASRQRIREIRKELSALNSERDELEKSLQNRRAELEHLMEGSFIAAKAKPLGLRPPDPRQRVIQLRLVATDKGLEVRPRIVGYNRR